MTNGEIELPHVRKVETTPPYVYTASVPGAPNRHRFEYEGETLDEVLRVACSDLRTGLRAPISISYGRVVMNREAIERECRKLAASSD